MPNEINLSGVTIPPLTTSAVIAVLVFAFLQDFGLPSYENGQWTNLRRSEGDLRVACFRQLSQYCCLKALLHMVDADV